jgi:hypothetical protein
VKLLDPRLELIWLLEYIISSYAYMTMSQFLSGSCRLRGIKRIKICLTS